MTNGEVLGNKLYELRKKSGLSQEELAERLGISRQAISKWECGESLPDTDNLITISKLYGVSLDELVGNTRIENTEAKDLTDKPAEENQITEYDEADNASEAEAEAYYSHDGTSADKKRKILRILYALPYPILVTIAFLVWGFFWNGWTVAWTLFVTIPIYYTVIDCIRAKKLYPFAYPVFAAFIYLFVGMQWGLWHPHWIIFVTIPVYYAIAEAIDSK